MAAVLGLVLLSHSGEAATITTLKLLKLDVPTGDAMFPPVRIRSDQQQCVACHSADHVLKPAFAVQRCLARSRQQDDHSYKAPVSPDDAKAIVDYLVRTKGAS